MDWHVEHETAIDMSDHNGGGHQHDRRGDAAEDESEKS
jgi:hypothetical protein